jgi:hypothetical protein
MKDRLRSFRRLVSVLALALTLICSFAYFAPANSLRAVAAQNTPLSGSFGFLINESFFMRPNNNGTAVLGVMNFDGAGNVSGPYTIQIGADRDSGRDEVRRSGKRDHVLHIRRPR